MKISNKEINCSGHDTFKCVLYDFDYGGEDAELLQEFEEKGEERAEKVNAAQANTSQKRSFERRLTDNILGPIAEYVWHDWLNRRAEETGLDSRVETSDDWESVTEEIDLTVLHSDGATNSIEVRSSCGYANFENLVCKYFDIIGWYENAVKQGENKKDYYARVVYPFHRSKLFEELESGNFEVYLTGGASREMLETSEHATDKTMNKESDLSSSRGQYRAIEPIVNGLDTVEFADIILD